ncbi:MAG: response regulator transcription factor [Chloroflexota bacterium]
MPNLKPIRILIVDDHRIVHQALSEMIGFVDDFELVGQGSNGHEAVALCAEHAPHVVLMDVVMPGMDGIEATRQILAQHPEIKILALSSFQDDASVHAMLSNGAKGYVLKDASVDELESVIRTVYEGNTVISSDLMQSLLQSSEAPTPTQDFNLSPREHEILKLIAEGMSYGQIASKLTISMSTVKFHVSNMLDKLSVATRNEAIAIAARNGLI